jgi:7-cyano-7-deazaguanine synthase
LFSGGLDSTALLYWKKPDLCFHINYGQKGFKGESRAVKQIAFELSLNAELISIHSSYFETNTSVSNNKNDQYPLEWIPYRNQLLITIAGIIGFSYGIKTILIGCVKSDKHYRDGTKEFFTKMDDICKYQEGNLRLKAPAIELSSAELIKKSKIPLSVLSWSHSCTQSELACGNCQSCQKHKIVMSELGFTPY